MKDWTLKLGTLLISLLLLGQPSVKADPLCNLRKYFAEDGLSNNVITSILQGKNGMMWFTTWNGLTSFDGYQFESYNTIQPGQFIKGQTRINNMFENSEGNFFCISQDNQVYLFDVTEKKFVNILQKAGIVNRNYAQTTIFSLPKGVSWIICRGQYCIRVEDSQCAEGRGITECSEKVQSKKIYYVFQDSEGDEWVLAEKSLTVMGKKKLRAKITYNQMLEKDGVLWLCSDDGRLSSYQLKTRKLTHWPIPYSIRAIRSLSLLGQNLLGLCTDNGLLMLNLKTFTFSRYDVRTEDWPRTEVHSVYEDRLGDFWMTGPSEGVLHLERSTGKVRLLQSPDDKDVAVEEKKNDYFIHEDPQGYLWVIPRNGSLSYYDRREGKLKHYYVDPKEPTTIVAPANRAYCIDRQGNLWMGSNKGLNKISFFSRNFELNLIDRKEWEVRAVMRDSRNNLWVASKAGYVRIYDAAGNLSGYLTENGSLSNVAKISIPNLYAMLEDRSGRIWLGTKKDGLYLIERQGGKSSIRHFRASESDPYSLGHDDIYSIFQDSKGHVWIGCHGVNGLNLVDFQKDGSLRFINRKNRMVHYPKYFGELVRCISENAQGEILVGSITGLIAFSSTFDTPESIRFFHHERNPNAKNTLSDDDVMSFFTDSRKQTYVVTRSGGVNRIKSKTLLSEKAEFETFNSANGLISDQTCSMMEDRKGQLWVVSRNAFSKFNPEKGTFDNYFGYAFMTPHINFSESTIAIDGQGKISIGSDKGLLRFDPIQIRKSRYVPPILFTGLTIQGQTFPDAFDHFEYLKLKPSQRSFTIQFSALDYSDPDRIQYAYLLEGIDKNWHLAGASHTASYVNLPKGHFRFHVKSTNSDGIWVNNERVMELRMQPTFWESIWGWILYVLLFIGLVTGIVYVLFTIYRLRHEVDIEQQLTQVKLNFFTDISHELRTPLTLIAGPVSDVIENESLSSRVKDQLTIVRENTDRMLRMINQILDFRKIQNDKMKLLVQKTEIVGFVAQVMENFRLLAQEKNIRFLFEHPDEDLELWVDTDKLEKILFNLLSNAFKYTAAGKSVTVSVRKTDDEITLSIADEGIGIPTQKLSSLFQRFETIMGENLLQPSSGIGLSMVKELVELHCGKTEVVSQLGEGSEFRVSFRTGYTHFEDNPQVEFLLEDESSENPELPDDSGEDENKGKVDLTGEERLSILIVEDNQDLRKFLKNILSREFSVAEAVNGQEGWEMAVSLQPDVIVSDIMMPVMDGLEMVGKIKENRDTCHIPIVLLSAKASLDNRIEGLEHGVDDYIIKPFSSSYLMVRIRSLISQRKALQELYLSTLSSDKNSSVERLISQSKLSEMDKDFIRKVMEFVEANIDNTDLMMEELAQCLFISRTVLYKKIKSLFGLSPVNFVRNYRVKKAVQMIETTDLSLSEIADRCGFSNLGYFSLCFKQQMGMSPSLYKNRRSES